ncbi:MAG: hypothetical protein ABIS86_05440 [Streptosporangiaceae bacterium]
MTSPSPYRSARAAIFAAVCVGLTSVGHWTASGEPLAPAAVGGGLLGVWLVAFALAGHERSLPTILIGLLGGQFTLHTLFTTGHLHHHGGAPPPITASDGTGTAMVAAHLLAGTVSAWWLWRGDRAAWRLARLTAATLLRPFRAAPKSPLPPVRAVMRPQIASAAVPRTALLRHVLVLRGPPAPTWAL